jgi:glycine betaine/proline transport system ATP-binding protein
VRRLVVEKLALVGLSLWADRAVGELSGGMQQRVGLARAFATDADVLLMDEPFSALDPLIRGKLQDELLSLQQRVRKTILFVSHDLDEALKLGDHISILEGGRIVQTGTAEDIVLRPADDYVAEFVHHMNPLTVLTGEMIMRPLAGLARDGDALWLDPARRARLALEAGGRPGACTLDGAPAPLVTATDEGALPAAGAAADGHSVALAPATFSLQAIIRLCQQTGLPVLLHDAQGRAVGACGEREIVAALAGRRADAAGQAHAAN